MKKLTPFLLLFLLAACQTPEQIALQRQMQAEQDIATCKAYGFRPDSEAFGNCRLQIDIARQQQYNYYGPYPRTTIGGGIYYVR